VIYPKERFQIRVHALDLAIERWHRLQNGARFRRAARAFDAIAHRREVVRPNRAAGALDTVSYEGNCAEVTADHGIPQFRDIALASLPEIVQDSALERLVPATHLCEYVAVHGLRPLAFAVVFSHRKCRLCLRDGARGITTSQRCSVTEDIMVEIDQSFGIRY
jgi:hypothetical protein